MNATVAPPDSAHWLTTTDRIGGFVYGIGVSVGILLLITTIILTSYFCTRSHISASPTTSPTTRRRQRQTNRTLTLDEQFHFHVDDSNDTVVVVEVLGLNEEDIKSFPKLPYEEARVSYSLQRDSTTTSCCSICLADYKKTDMIRILPDCNHLFHDKCVDPWLRLHPTCPVCRTSPLPSPALTPRLTPVPDVVSFSPRPIDI